MSISTSVRAHDGHEYDAKRAQMLEQVSEDSPSNLGAFREAYATDSLRAAINAHCLECMWMDRRAIRECTSTQCGLWNVRPYQQKRGKS